MAPTREGEYGRALRGGVIAGLAGGGVLSVYRVLVNLARGTPGPVLAGIVCHMAVSAIWGLLFGLYFYGLSTGWMIVVGVLWGLLVWLVMFRLVLPLLGLTSIEASTPHHLVIFGHVLYGLATALCFLPLQRPESAV